MNKQLRILTRSIMCAAVVLLATPPFGWAEGVERRGGDPLELTGEMRIWARKEVDQTGDPMPRLVALWRALVDQRRLGIRPEQGRTASARQAFEQRRANCTAFALLFASLARDIGLTVDFALVGGTVRYRDSTDFKIAERHMGVVHDKGGEVWLFDPERISIVDPQSVVRISDRTARAVYHSNRGVERLPSDAAGAEAELRRALELDPALDIAWVNLGVALRGRARSSEAEEAFRRAIQIEPNSLTAWRNLAMLLQARNANSR
jgi:tetratricopeptide (TPR) repeat protein